jgi:hypothetical protein
MRASFWLASQLLRSDSGGRWPTGAQVCRRQIDKYCVRQWQELMSSSRRDRLEEGALILAQARARVVTPPARPIRSALWTLWHDQAISCVLLCDGAGL